MKSVITALVPNREEMLFGEIPYRLEIKGEPEPLVKVTELLDTETGRKMVRIVAMASAGMPAQPLSTLDAIARRLLPNARVTAANKGSAAYFRMYAVPEE